MKEALTNLSPDGNTLSGQPICGEIRCRVNDVNDFQKCADELVDWMKRWRVDKIDIGWSGKFE